MRKNTVHDIMFRTEPGPDGCINWTGPTRPNGYGIAYYHGKIFGAHRLVYMLLVRGIPYGLYVLHKCDNRRCVNPEHLFLGTHRDNMRDMVEKHRHCHRERHNRAKLTEQDVADIRNSTEATGKLTARYGVSASAIHRVRTGKYWPDDTPPPTTWDDGKRRGQQHPGTKLTNEDVAAIRARHAAGESTKELAAEYGMSYSGLSHMVSGRTWKVK